MRRCAPTEGDPARQRLTTGMVLLVPLIGHRQLPEGKFCSENPAQGMRDWFGLDLERQPLHVVLVGPLSCLVDGVYWVLLA